MLSQDASAQAAEKTVIAGFNTKLAQRVANFSSSTGVRALIKTYCSRKYTNYQHIEFDSLRRGFGTPTPRSPPSSTTPRRTDSWMPHRTATPVISGGEYLIPILQFLYADST